MKQYIFKVIIRNAFTQGEEVYHSTGFNINKAITGLKDAEIIEIVRVMEETVIGSGIFKPIV